MYYLCDRDILIKDILLKMKLKFQLSEFESILIVFYFTSMSFACLEYLKIHSKEFANVKR